MAPCVVDCLNGVTATALNDFTKPVVLHNPAPFRATIRFLVVIVAAVGFVIATVLIYHIQPVYRVQTVISTGHNVNNALAFGTKMLFDQKQTNLSGSTHPDSLQVVCPCAGSSLMGISTKEEWAVYLNFSLISLVDGTQDQFKHTNFSTFCNDPTACNGSCFDILRAAIPDCDWSSNSYRLNHNILSPNLLSLDSLRDAIYTQTFLNEKFSKVEDDNQFFRFALEKMLDQTKQNSASSDLDFWAAAASTRSSYNYNFALAMHIDWVAYSKLCNPQVCTAVMYVPHWKRSLNAVGLMGGYLSIIQLALGTVIWPGLVCLCRWSPHKQI